VIYIKNLMYILKIIKYWTYEIKTKINFPFHKKIDEFKEFLIGIVFYLLILIHNIAGLLHHVSNDNIELFTILCLFLVVIPNAPLSVPTVPLSQFSGHTHCISMLECSGFPARHLNKFKFVLELRCWSNTRPPNKDVLGFP